jgi:hypothetical protein
LRAASPSVSAQRGGAWRGDDRDVLDRLQRREAGGLVAGAAAGIAGAVHRAAVRAAGQAVRAAGDQRAEQPGREARPRRRRRRQRADVEDDAVGAVGRRLDPGRRVFLPQHVADEGLAVRVRRQARMAVGPRAGGATALRLDVQRQRDLLHAAQPGGVEVERAGRAGQHRPARGVQRHRPQGSGIERLRTGGGHLAVLGSGVVRFHQIAGPHPGQAAVRRRAGQQVAAAQRLHAHHDVAGAAGVAGAQHAVRAGRRHDRRHGARLRQRGAGRRAEHPRDIGAPPAILEEQPHRMRQVVHPQPVRQDEVRAVAEMPLELREGGDEQRRAARRPEARLADEAGNGGRHPLDRLGPEGGLLHVGAGGEVFGHTRHLRPV